MPDEYPKNLGKHAGITQETDEDLLDKTMGRRRKEGMEMNSGARRVQIKGRQANGMFSISRGNAAWGLC
eukprot:755698-Hanusia_phi.AAC.4